MPDFATDKQTAIVRGDELLATFRTMQGHESPIAVDVVDAISCLLQFVDAEATPAQLAAFTDEALIRVHSQNALHDLVSSPEVTL